ncbi:LOG family protein [Streptomyces capitiformicae]|uniref:Cytokinin riboside 5'-monophosphate phosphoribohydrolase n=1 Tax=Streptomyces capitiformicae TaxID=2014920 RepID=A0A919DBE7_9ACTN|nr:TIGR00730 family Rossman fold protein [Streptomyces capitiformicae]GHE34578.1 cytokinin riboside 5'-monophosphate phosphoribohydrolase [Streptomyces capitiformicae]
MAGDLSQVRTEDGTSLSVAVFCGARPGVSPRVTQCAEAVGALLGTRGHRLVYGAGGVGVMGAVAHAAERHGAPITGVIPRFLRELERDDAAPEQELVVTEDMFTRKREIFARADAFLALPGGYGTLDEVIEVVSLNYLGQHPRPLVLLDVDAFWTPLLRAVTAVQERGFTRGPLSVPFEITADPVTAFESLEKMAGGVRAR